MDTVIFWVDSIYGSALVGFGLEPARLLQIPMAVWIFDQNVLFNAAIIPPSPSKPHLYRHYF